MRLVRCPHPVDGGMAADGDLLQDPIAAYPFIHHILLSRATRFLGGRTGLPSSGRPLIRPAGPSFIRLAPHSGRV